MGKGEETLTTCSSDRCCQVYRVFMFTGSPSWENMVTFPVSWVSAVSFTTVSQTGVVPPSPVQAAERVGFITLSSYILSCHRRYFF